MSPRRQKSPPVRVSALSQAEDESAPYVTRFSSVPYSTVAQLETCTRLSGSLSLHRPGWVHQLQRGLWGETAEECDHSCRGQKC